jgi:hypothetical protein
VLTDTLCTRCGLCCDGTLLGDVELTGRREAARLEALGLELDTDDADGDLLALPCTGISGTRCTVYAHRPRCCRTFECRLLQDTRRGVVTPQDALARIERARAQVARVEAHLGAVAPAGDPRLPLAERVADALATPAGRSSPSDDRRTQLRLALAALQRTIRTTFLD